MRCHAQNAGMSAIKSTSFTTSFCCLLLALLQASSKVSSKQGDERNQIFISVAEMMMV
jgi:hypothetical protein